MQSQKLQLATIEEINSHFLKITSTLRDDTLEYVKETGDSKFELNKKINKLFTYDSFTQKEKDSLKWVDEIEKEYQHSNEIYFQNLRKITLWYTHLKLYQDKEDFEMCINIQKAVDIEIKELEFEKYGDIIKKIKNNLFL